MNNSACYKTMENLRNRVDEKLVNNNKSYKKLAYKSRIVLQKISSKNCVAIHQTDGVSILNNPAYVCVY